MARHSAPRWLLPAIVAVALGAAAVAIVTLGGDEKKASAGEIWAEPVDEVGPTPFTPPVVTTNPAAATTSTSTSTTTTTTTTTTIAASTTSGPSTSSTSGTSGASSTSLSPVVTASTTPPTTTPVTLAPPVAFTTTPRLGGGNQPAVVPTVPGDRPGLYGGTQNDKVCDAEMLVSFLESSPDKAAAWAKAQGIEVAEIRNFVSKLTPVLLRADTRVTNYGFKDGEPVPRQAVLQAGTAVFVDQFGVPRARCKCGNPLGEPKPVNGPTSYSGTTWPGLDPSTSQVVTPTEQPVDKLVLTDPTTGGMIERPVGGGTDVPIDSGGSTSTTSTVPALPEPTTTIAGSATTIASTTTAAPTTTVAETTTTAAPTTTTAAPTTTEMATTTTVLAPIANITAEGQFGASTEFPGGQYPASAAFDGDPGTSWFSAGDADTSCTPITPGVSCSSLIWVDINQQTDRLISEVHIIGNTLNTDPSVRSGYGFGSVVVIITNLAGAEVYQQTFILDGDELGIDTTPNVRGHSVTLIFEGHDSPDCGGISEFTVIGA